MRKLPSPYKRAAEFAVGVGIALAVDARLDPLIGEPGALMLGALALFVAVVLVRLVAIWAEDDDRAEVPRVP